jgi:hypothetical protein
MNVTEYIIYVMVGILLTCGKHLHNSITSLRGGVWVHKTSLTPPFFTITYWCVRLINLCIFLWFFSSIWSCSDSAVIFFSYRTEIITLFCLHYSDIVRIDQPLEILYFVCTAKMSIGQTLKNTVLFWYWFGKYTIQRESLYINMTYFFHCGGTTSWESV